MDLLGRDPKALPCLQSQTGKQGGRIMFGDPIQGSPQTIIIELVSGNSLP